MINEKALREEILVLALGWKRYEALRTLNPREFTAFYERNMKGENFDAMVDELMKARAK